MEWSLFLLNVVKTCPADFFEIFTLVGKHISLIVSLLFYESSNKFKLRDYNASIIFFQIKRGPAKDGWRVPPRRPLHV